LPSWVRKPGSSAPPTSRGTGDRQVTSSRPGGPDGRAAHGRE
jgi:hypothetical protein